MFARARKCSTLKRKNLPYFFPSCEANYHIMTRCHSFRTAKFRAVPGHFRHSSPQQHHQDSGNSGTGQAKRRHKVPDIKVTLLLAKFETKILVMVHLFFQCYVVGCFIYLSVTVRKERSRQT